VGLVRVFLDSPASFSLCAVLPKAEINEANCVLPLLSGQKGVFFVFVFHFCSKLR